MDASLNCNDHQGVCRTIYTALSNAALQLGKLIGKITLFAVSLFQGLFCCKAFGLSKPIEAQKIIGEAKIRIMVQDLFTEKEISEEYKLSTIDAKKALSDYFDRELVNSIFSLYKLQRNTMTVNELKAAIVGIQANMTLEALHTVYLQRKELGLNSPLLQIELTKPTQLQLIDLLAELRKKSIDPKPSDLRCQTQLNRDSKFLERLRHIPRFDASSPAKNQDKAFQKFRFPEFLARAVVYHLLPSSSAGFIDGVLFFVYDERIGEEPVLMEAHVSMRRSGLHAINVIPAMPVSDTISTSSPLFQKYGFIGATVFRGTQLGDFSSILRDIDVKNKVMKLQLNSGPGCSDFPDKEQQLRADIRRDILKLRNKLMMHENDPLPLSWDFIGHSLGGTDAQRLALTFSKSDAALLKRLSVWTFNSPRIERKAAQTFLENVNRHPKVQFSLYHARTDGDVVQTAGEVLLGNFTESDQIPSNLAATVASFDVDESSRKKRHSAYNTAAQKRDGRHDNPTYVAHLASNDAEFQGVKYGKELNKLFTPNLDALRLRLNKPRKRKDLQVAQES